MPKKPIDYTNTHFYKICCKDLEVKDIYVGHTTDFRKRRNHHKLSCNNETSNKHNMNVYQVIRENNGWDNWDMILIETRSCNDALDAKKIERKYIEELQASLNRSIPGRSNEEYREQFRDKLNEKRRIYHKEHREIALVKQRKYIEEHKDILLAKQRKYDTEHREQRQLYREQNKQAIKEQMGKPCTCEVCGGTYTHCHKARHCRSIKHQKALEAQNQAQDI
jgi:hypothetical protein